MRFSLKAEAEKTLTEIVKEFDEACTIHRDVFMKNSRMVNGELKEWSTNFQKERQEIKEESNKMVYFAELCLGALNNKIDIEKEDSDLQRIKKYIQFAKILNDAVECENNVATGEQSYKINTGKLAEYDGVINVDENAGIDGCLNCSMWASAFAICEIIDICIEQSELIKKIKQTNCYKQLSEVCNNLELGNEYDAIMNLTIDNWDCDYTREEIVKLVIADKNRSNKNQGYYNLKTFKKDKSNLFEWVYWFNVWEKNPYYAINSRVNNGDKIWCITIGSPNFTESSYFFSLTEQAEAIDKYFEIKGNTDIELNKTSTTTEHSVQKDNTYKILQTEEQKIYWDENKLILEIPVDLPEEMKITILNDVEYDFKITDFQLYLDYHNPNYLVESTLQNKIYLNHANFK